MVRLLQVAAMAVALAGTMRATARARRQRRAASGDRGTMDPLPGTVLQRPHRIPRRESKQPCFRGAVVN
jgi:hypothetical protein